MHGQADDGEDLPEARLDPVRWQRPGRGALIRSAAVAALLVTAVLIAWSRPAGCPPPGATASSVSTEPGSGPGSGTASGSDAARTAGVLATDSSGSASRPDAASPGTAARPAVPSGTVGVPVRLAEPAALALVGPGDRIELLGVGESGGAVTRIAADALVLGVTGVHDPTAGGLLLALTPAEARRAVGAPERTRFAVLLHPA